MIHMKRTSRQLSIRLIVALCLIQGTLGAEGSDRWRMRIDLGGVVPQDADLTEFDGPLGDKKFRLGTGFQSDMALDYQLTPWLAIGPELGFTFNGVESIGGWSTDNTILSQLLFSANVVVQYPTEGRLVPFAGAGIGASVGFLTFWGDSYDADDYPYADPDGAATDCALALQAFGGLRYRVGENLDLGVVYRFLTTQPWNWDVNWQGGPDFTIGTDRLLMHSVCLVLSGTF
jgi:opacity protein-like surface antigen